MAGEERNPGSESGRNGDHIEMYEAKTESGFDQAMEKRISRKFDFHILPWLFGMWLLAFIDRSNIGNAKIDGLTEMAPGNEFNIALAVFYIPYILVDVPSNLVLKYFKAGYYLPFLLTSWGVVSMCTGFVKSYGGLIAARLFLGLAEGGLLGGMVLYLSMFYRRHQMMFRISLFYCAAPLAGAIGGILATGLAFINYGGYQSWPWIFFVEGAITVVFGILCFFFMPHSPGEAKFLTQEERDLAVQRMSADMHGNNTDIPSSVTMEEDKFSSHWFKMALFNINTIFLSLNFFLIITPIYSFSLFLPSIIVSLVKDPIIAQLFTIPPNFCGFIMVLIAGVVSDRVKQRGFFMIGGVFLAIIGYIILIASKEPYTQWGGTFFVAAGIFPCSPLVMAWLANNLHPHYVRATGTGFQIAVANLAAFVATFTYLEQDAPRYTTGHAINIGMLGGTLICTTGLIWYNKRENRKRESGERDYRLKEYDPGKLGHKHPVFRYTS